MRPNKNTGTLANVIKGSALLIAASLFSGTVQSEEIATDPGD
jgi:hypothetical protein